MTEQELKKLLDNASKRIDCGIYAVGYKGCIEFVCEEMSKTQTKARRKQLKRLGYKAYCTGV